jgi:hypothetical protein
MNRISTITAEMMNGPTPMKVSSNVSGMGRGLHDVDVEADGRGDEADRDELDRDDASQTGSYPSPVSSGKKSGSVRIIIANASMNMPRMIAMTSTPRGSRAAEA